jgi:hypothetical protein
MVGGQRENAIAILLRQHGAQRDGGMAAERHLAIRRKIAHAPAIALRRGKHGFRIAHLGSNALHGRLSGNAARIITPAGLPPSSPAVKAATL